MKYFDVMDGEEWIFTGSYKEISEKFGISRQYLRIIFSNERLFRRRYKIVQAEMIDENIKTKKEKPIKKGRKYKEYAVYKGEEILAVGTVKELAKELNLKEETIWFLTSPTNFKRDKGNKKVAILIEDEQFEEGE